MNKLFKSHPLRKRGYLPGDEEQINALYRLIAGIDRSNDEYRWEWLGTWNGRGSMWLAFDENREPGDQLIMQYSLIPTPMSVFGKTCLAAKTENCMCHPVYRGSGLYFKHEKRSFEDAKQSFQLFFTTDGTAGRGAAGAVRRKLGYMAFDSWVQYFFLTDANLVQQKIDSVFSQRMESISSPVGFLSACATSLVTAYFRPRDSKCYGYEARVFDKSDSPLEDVEALWCRNKGIYGISVDRNQSYMHWRLDRNPYFEHRYLGLYDKKRMVGYVVFYRDGHHVMRVVDILADNKSVGIFCQLLGNLTALATRERAAAVSCTTLAGNRILRNALKKSRFVRRDIMSDIRNWRKKKEMPFHVYVKGITSEYPGALERRNWYITELVMEGRR